MSRAGLAPPNNDDEKTAGQAPPYGEEMSWSIAQVNGVLAA